MLAKRFALGFGIAVILPIMVHYGVSTFSPQPRWEDYQIDNYHERHQRATPQEQIKLENEKLRLEKERLGHEKRFQKHLFYIAAPVGIVSVIIGAVVPIHAVGTGLMFGGIFTLVDGYISYWSQLLDWMRFSSLVIAFIILIIIGCRRCIDQEKK